MGNIAESYMTEKLTSEQLAVYRAHVKSSNAVSMMLKYCWWLARNSKPTDVGFEDTVSFGLTKEHSNTTWRKATNWRTPFESGAWTWRLTMLPKPQRKTDSDKTFQ